MIRRAVNRIARLCKAIAPHHRSKSMAEKRDSSASDGRGSSQEEQSEKQGAVDLPPNDHRRIGRDQELFFFNHLSPGSAFWFPRGAHIYNKLVDFIKEQYRQRGFKEVITPNIYNSRLWEKSGHWQHYADNIFRFDVDKETYGLKPMNCPGHCLMFDQIPRAYNKLPMRLADFGVLHRDESSGSLCGLTRVRRFQQDDAHIFCRPDQIVEEIKGCLDFLDFCYCKVFGFSFELLLSTRPDTGSLGEKEAWDDAESQLKQALDDSGREWKLNPGDGAFYGPKIDITIRDALKRLHQCATIQLDFQLPQRFDLAYFDPNKDKKRPVMIHRAVLGSVERMVAILAENFDGKWPFWLSPRQAAIITVHKSLDDYAKSVYTKLHEAGFEVEFDEDSSETLKKRIRNAQVEKFNFILVIGRAEEKNGTVNLRTRDNEVRGEVKVDDLISKFRRLRDERVLNDGETAEAWSSV